MTGSREGPVPCVPQHTGHVQSACLTERARGVRALNRRELPRRLRGALDLSRAARRCRVCTTQCPSESAIYAMRTRVAAGACTYGY